jgi:hypothetical protein
MLKTLLSICYLTLTIILLGDSCAMYTIYTLLMYILIELALCLFLLIFFAFLILLVIYFLGYILNSGIRDTFMILVLMGL